MVSKSCLDVFLFFLLAVDFPQGFGRLAMSMDVKHVVKLTVDERNELQSMVDQGRNSKTVRQRARVLLKTDESSDGPGWTDVRAAEFAEVLARKCPGVKWSSNTVTSYATRGLTGLPAPCKRLRCGPIWTGDQVGEYVRLRLAKAVETCGEENESGG